MARRSSSKKSYQRPQVRRALPNPNANRLRLHNLPVRPVSPIVRPSLNLFEDRRTFHPNRFARPAISIGKRADTKLVVPPDPLKSVQRLNHVVGFKVPRRVVICVRRKIRKEVIHAIGAGGSKNLRKPHKNEFSKVKC